MNFGEDVFLSYLLWKTQWLFESCWHFEMLTMAAMEDKLVSKDKNAQRASKLYLLHSSKLQLFTC